MQTIFKWKVRVTESRRDYILLKLTSGIANGSKNTARALLTDFMAILDIAMKNAAKAVNTRYEQTEWLCSEGDNICHFYLHFKDPVDVICFIEDVRQNAASKEKK